MNVGLFKLSIPTGVRFGKLCLLQGKEKRVMSFPENKEDRKNSEQAWTSLVSSTLTAPNSVCLWLSLLFCPLTLQELHFVPVILAYPYNTLLTLWFLFKKKSERRPQSHWTARLNYWVTDASLWLSLNKFVTLCSSSLTPDFKSSSFTSTSGKEPTCWFRRRKRHRFDPGVGKILWRRKGNPLQYSCLENSWREEPIHGVRKSWTWLSDWTTITMAWISVEIQFIGGQMMGPFKIRETNKLVWGHKPKSHWQLWGS